MFEPQGGGMRGKLKVLKGIFFFLMGLIMLGCAGIMICALNPSLTAMLADRVESTGAMEPGQSGQSGGLGSLFHNKDMQPDVVDSIEGQPGINEDWLEGQDGYEKPDASVEPPGSLSDRTGYKPVQEEAQQIEEDEAHGLVEARNQGETGSNLSFDGEIYPYYAMLEEDMQEIYKQIYANAQSLIESFAPVTDVSVNQLKTVFEAVYKDRKSVV